jgi:hypothetical protein
VEGQARESAWKVRRGRACERLGAGVCGPWHGTADLNLISVLCYVMLWYVMLCYVMARYRRPRLHQRRVAARRWRGTAACAPCTLGTTPHTL